MKPYYIRKAAIFIGSLMILIPCVLLMAWEDSIPNITFLWLLLTITTALFSFALYAGEKKRAEHFTVKLFLSKCGGFCVMLCFIVYKLITSL